MATDRERYMNAILVCMSKAQCAGSAEIRSLWMTIASSYDYLLQREERLEAERALGDDRRKT
jgi:hypothetical protein